MGALTYLGKYLITHLPNSTLPLTAEMFFSFFLDSCRVIA